MLTSGPHGARWTFDLSTCVPQGAAIVLGRHNLKPSTGVSSACWWLISNAFWGFEVNAIENFERILLQVKPSNRYLKLQHFDGEPCLKVLKSFSPEKSTLSPKMWSKGKTPCDPSFHLTWSPLHDKNEPKAFQFKSSRSFGSRYNRFRLKPGQWLLS